MVGRTATRKDETMFLDDDLYAISQMNAIIQTFPDACAQYTFINRGGHKFPANFHSRLNELIDRIASKTITEDEDWFLGENCPFLSTAFLGFLRGFRLDPTDICATQYLDDFRLTVSGPWYKTKPWEVRLLAAISELYYQITGRECDEDIMRTGFQDKSALIEKHSLPVADFGTRRRFSYGVQDELVDYLQASCPSFVGTSNMHFAMLNGIKPIGTMAHEWIMAHGAAYGYRMANKMALENWAKVYGGNLGIALTDTYGTENFFQSFDMKLAKLFDGVRHDSGDPFEFAIEAISHYEKLGIDPMSKTVVFSDGLDVPKAVEIFNTFKGRIKMSFGIGTNLTNDVGHDPLNIVIKMTAFKPDRNSPWIPTVKLSDVPGKETGDQEEVRRCKETINA